MEEYEIIKTIGNVRLLRLKDTDAFFVAVKIGNGNETHLFYNTMQSAIMAMDYYADMKG